MSGGETRSGLRNRSNSNPCCIGLTSMIWVRYETIDPAAEPRPGPTGTPWSRAYWQMSATMRKYELYPIGSMTLISSSMRSRRSDGGLSPNRIWMPRSISLRSQDDCVSPGGTTNCGIRST